MRKILMVCLFGIFLIACSDADQTKNEETNEDVNEEEIEVVEDEPTVAAPDWEYEGIEDENLRLIVLEALDMSNQTDDDTKPTEEDLKKLERISTQSVDVDDENDKVKSLKGLEFATNLEHLKLFDHAVSDLEPLSNLKKLRKIDLYGNQVEDLSPLSELKNLEILVLTFNDITDISPLTDLVNIFALDVGYNEVSDIRVLSNLKELDDLHIQKNNITDSTFAG